MIYGRTRGLRRLPRGAFGALAVVALAAVLAAAASGISSAATPIRIGILSDCQGAFGNQYDADIKAIGG